MEGWDIVFCNDTKTIVNNHIVSKFLGNGWITDCKLFDLLHAEIGHNEADRTAHRTAMDLFVNSIIEHEIVVGQGEL